MSLTKTDL